MFSISTTMNGDSVEVKPSGRLDAKAANEAGEAFEEAAKKANNVVLDMSELDYISSAGLRALKRLHADTAANGGSLKLRGVQDDVMEIFEMTGFVALLSFE